MSKPDNVSEVEWQWASYLARSDLHRLARLVRSGRVMRDRGARKVLPLPPPPRNPTIRPKRKKRR